VSTPPPKGQMYLFNSVTPPLEDGSYRLSYSTTISGPIDPPAFTDQKFFDIVGPRFNVPQSTVAGTFPPTNGHGSFQDSLPHIVLSRRTLPWERELDPEGKIPAPEHNANDAPVPTDPVPWVALLLFEEGEYTWYPNLPLEKVVPADVFARLGSPANITCDAVEAELSLIESILPSMEELQLLTHVRWVNVDDRELNTAGGDGYFSVVVSSRLPSPGAQCRAVLVSLEERSDLVKSNPPPVAIQITQQRTGLVEGRAEILPPAPAGTANPTILGAVDQANIDIANQAVLGAANVDAVSTTFTLSQSPTHAFPSKVPIIYGFPTLQLKRLVALYSWKFTCEGPGTFRDLMQGLLNGDAMFGNVADPGHPPLSDTGHLQIALDDRLGAVEQVWYRGPLVQYQLTRDPLGPYHSADQARRVAPETGAEDISYAAAFEVGRLLAAADPRLAQALMRWRRESYKQAARADTITAVGARIPLDLPATLAQQLHTPIPPLVSVSATQAIVNSGPLIADAYGLGKVAAAAGLNPATLAAAWQLNPTDAADLLGANTGSLGAEVTAPPETVRADTTLGDVAADSAGLGRLSTARTQTVQNAVVQLENS
jgi:hypothetical protein